MELTQFTSRSVNGSEEEVLAFLDARVAIEIQSKGLCCFWWEKEEKKSAVSAEFVTQESKLKVSLMKMSVDFVAKLYCWARSNNMEDGPQNSENYDLSELKVRQEKNHRSRSRSKHQSKTRSRSRSRSRSRKEHSKSKKSKRSRRSRSRTRSRSRSRKSKKRRFLPLKKKKDR